MQTSENAQIRWGQSVVLEMGGLSRRSSGGPDQGGDIWRRTLISVSIVEKSVDCPPTVPQYCCATPFLPPTTTVLTPSNFDMVIYATRIVS